MFRAASSCPVSVKTWLSARALRLQAAVRGQGEGLSGQLRDVDFEHPRQVNQDRHPVDGAYPTFHLGQPAH